MIKSKINIVDEFFEPEIIKFLNERGIFIIDVWDSTLEYLKQKSEGIKIEEELACNKLDKFLRRGIIFGIILKNIKNNEIETIPFLRCVNNKKLKKFINTKLLK